MAHENFVSNALTSLGAVDQNAKGKLYIDGQAVNAELSQVIAETIYIKQIFRDGQSVTGKYAAGLRANGLVRVLLDTPLPFAARTLSMAGRTGTTGNDGVINRNGKIMPSTQDFNVVVNQRFRKSLSLSTSWLVKSRSTRSAFRWTATLRRSRKSSRTTYGAH